MANWKTTLFGTLAGLCGVLATTFPDYKELLIAVAGVFTALVGFYAKDKNVTGGKTPNDVTG